MSGNRETSQPCMVLGVFKKKEMGYPFLRCRTRPIIIAPPARTPPKPGDFVWVEAGEGIAGEIVVSEEEAGGGTDVGTEVICVVCETVVWVVGRTVGPVVGFVVSVVG
jgi:hypothetical protein